LTQGQSQEVTREGAGDAFSTPDDVAAGFTQATVVPDPEAAKDEGQKVAPAPVDAGTGPAAGDTGAADPTDTGITDKAEDAAQKETGQTVEIKGKPRQGYFAGMLTHQCGGPYLDNVYVSDTRQDFNADTVTAVGLEYPGSIIEGKAGAGIEGGYLQNVNFNGSYETGPLGPNWPITHGELGYNDYQEWGWWYVANTFLINTFIHDLWQKGYYVFGFATPDEAVSGISGTYSGLAYGTYWEAAGSAPQGIAMTGTFSCEVDGAAGTIDNLVIDVSGGTKEALISGADGTFSSSSFNINTGTGTWLLDSSITPTSKSCHGSLYGPKGEHIGGAWGMWEDGTDDGAAGIFQGNKD